MNSEVLTFEQYCSKFKLDVNDSKSKEQYDTYCKNVHDGSGNLDSLRKDGKLPGELFD